MRKFNGFDVFEIIRLNKREEYLYMTQNELFQEKLKTDENIIQWKSVSESIENSYMHYFPNPSIMYTLNLIESAIISIVIDYKFTNLARFNSKHSMQEENPEITDFIITAVKEDPEISYMDLINLGNEKDEFEIYLEKLIDNKVISRYEKNNNKYWKVNKIIKL